jgi:phosphopantetheinyl transferase
MTLKLGVPLVELTVPPLDLVALTQGAPATPMPAPPPAAASPASTTYRETLRFSVDDYPELIDHCLIPQPEDWPVLEDRAPTVPMTMSIELMQDLAERANPGTVAVTVENVLAKAWLGVEPPVSLDATVEALADGRSRAQLATYIEGTISTAASYPAAPAPRNTVLVDEKVPRLTAARVYRDGWLFHGPQYQGIVGLEATGRNGMRATLRALPAKGALLDAAGQVLGLWIMLNAETDLLAMPVRLRRASFFAPPPEPGQLVQCHVEIKQITDHEVRADIELVVDGSVYALLEGWEDWRFQTGGGIYEIMRHPARNLLSEPRGDRAVLVENFGWTGATIEYLGNRFLTADERRDGKAKHSQRKYAEWLAGRIAAKDAVRRYLYEHGHPPLFPAEVQVENDAEGRPYVRGPFEADLHLSISHKDNLAAALVSEGTGCGIDIERIEDHGEGFARYAFDEGELALLPSRSSEWLTRLWTAKEAVSKALGTGISDPRSLRLSTLEEANLMVNGHWVETQQVGDYILAWTRA